MKGRRSKFKVWPFCIINTNNFLFKYNNNKIKQTNTTITKLSKINMRTFTFVLFIALFFSAVFAGSVTINANSKTTIKTPKSNVDLETTQGGAGSKSEEKTDGGASASHDINVNVKGAN